MRYFIDTEFNEDGRTITLISIGIVSEDGRELYLINRDADRTACNSWVQEHVWPQLDAIRSHGGGWHSHQGIRHEIEAFVGTDQSPEFWGYFADYDWVVFCWLWGRMVDLPAHFPKFCMDLKQEAKRLGVRPRDIVLPATTEHNAFADARWNAELFAALQRVSTGGTP